MAIPPGTRVGSYEILSAIGAGGMGEVYRARDTRLKRDVALKVLPASLAGDSDRLARFRREAEVLASLNHPAIAAIYGLEEGALVLELVDGVTLADVIAAGPMPIPEALSIARQICDALDAAHEQGVVHRDLKPANIKVRSDGSVKVLDFGLAKAIESLPSIDTTIDAAATVTSPAVVTHVGVILGTAAYMSPEQARGKPVDKRSDIWAFGCVLYEMLTGRRAFEGDSVTDTLSRVLQREPDLSALPEATPVAVRRLLARCLEKDRNKRLPQIAAAAFQIDETLAGTTSAAQTPTRAARAASLLVPASIAIGLLGVAVGWMIAKRAPVVSAPVTHLQLSVSPADQLGGIVGRPPRTAIAISPDGRTLVFSALQKNRRALYARPLDQPTATMIPGTEEGVGPFFSPDGSWIGYWAPGQLRKIPLKGGPSVLIVASPQIFGASWGDDDRIVFARGAAGLLEVPAAGGTARELTTVSSERGEINHRLPNVLPGSDAILFTVTKERFPRWDATEVWIHTRSTGVAKKLIDGAADARYASSGHLLYTREGELLAVPFDIKRLELSGGPAGIVPDVMQAAYVAGSPNDTGATQISVSNTGTLVYVAGGIHPATLYDAMLLDRTGQGEALPIEPQDFRTLKVAPDGSRVALATTGRDRGIWIYSFMRKTWSRLAAAGRSTTPSWTPDGERITFSATANGPNNVYWVRADGVGTPELLVTNKRNLETGGWTPNARELIYYEIPSEGIAGERRGPTVFIQDIADKTAARVVSDAPGAGGADVSPDGRWVAYHSTESGRLDVYVDPLTGSGPRLQVSTTGGGSPVWRRDGRELFYLRPLGEVPRPGMGGASGGNDMEIMAVSVTTAPTLVFGPPRRLFAGKYAANAPVAAWDVMPDGQHVVLLQARERAPDVITQVSVVQNWTQMLK